jgi:hypothetical protein
MGIPSTLDKLEELSQYGSYCVKICFSSFVGRRTIVCRTSKDCLSNVEQLFVERRTMAFGLWLLLNSIFPVVN